jgi:hypothetical protein
MNDKFENELREALRPVDPDEDFASRVMSRIRFERPRRRNWQMPAALAASLILGVVLVHAWQVQRERQGLQARQQLMEALRVTGEKLDLVYRGVNGEARPDAPNDNAGA